MQETINGIIERVGFKESVKFGVLLKKCIRPSTDTEKSTYATEENIIFHMDKFFKGFPPYLIEFGRAKKYESGVVALNVISDELGLELDKEECFILFHIRDIGKFRVKEIKLKQELTILWREYKEYALCDQDFSYALKSLMKKKFIEYRRGSIQLNPNVVFRYR